MSIIFRTCKLLTIPGLISRTTFLRDQVTYWDWNPSTDQAFQYLKATSHTLLKTTLANHNHTKPLVFQTNTSDYDLSADLLQNSQPTAFASKTLTDVKSRYANIEREFLSVFFGLEKFHTYIYGCHIIVQNDHKALEMIQKKLIQLWKHHPDHNEFSSKYKNMTTPYNTGQGKR